MEAEIKTSSHRPCKCQRTRAFPTLPSQCQTTRRRLEYACPSMLAQLLPSMTSSQGEPSCPRPLVHWGLRLSTPTLNTKPRGKVTCPRASVKWQEGQARQPFQHCILPRPNSSLGRAFHTVYCIAAREAGQAGSFNWLADPFYHNHVHFQGFHAFAMTLLATRHHTCCRLRCFRRSIPFSSANLSSPLDHPL